MSEFKTFEQCLPEIEREIAKRRSRWTLSSITWMDFDDVSQIVRIHIHRKWHLYDQTRPLLPWVNRVISSQIKNLVRNHYSNFCRPCLKCPAAEDIDGCVIYQKQGSECPLYRRWENVKKQAYQTKLPHPLEKHANEISNQPTDSFDLEKAVQSLHEFMKKRLKASELKVYRCLYIENKGEEEAARECGFKTTEENRKAGYRQLKNIQKKIIDTAKDILKNEEIEIF